ncbi:MAG: Bax inhibitor 1 [Paramarteilia canceri]
MDFVSSTLSSLFNVTRLDNTKKQHLRNVYACVGLLLALLIFAERLTAGFRSFVEPFIFLLPIPFIGSGLVFACSSNRKWKKNALIINSICTGIFLHFFTSTINSAYPNVVFNALLTTSVVVAGYTIASFFADNSTLLFVSSIVSIMGLFLSFASIGTFFSKSLAINSISMNIIKNSSFRDPLDDVYILFISIVDLFITLLKAFLAKEARREENRESRRNKRD